MNLNENLWNHLEYFQRSCEDLEESLKIFGLFWTTSKNPNFSENKFQGSDKISNEDLESSRKTLEKIKTLWRESGDFQIILNSLKKS